MTQCRKIHQNQLKAVLSHGKSQPCDLVRTNVEPVALSQAKTPPEATMKENVCAKQQLVKEIKQLG